MSVPAQRLRRAWPLAGRTEELSAVAGALRGRGGVRGVVLVGPAGVGKTRLAREALAGAAEAGVATRWVVATESARAVPLGSFAPVVRNLDPDAVGVTALRAAAAELLRDTPPAGVVI